MKKMIMMLAIALVLALSGCAGAGAHTHTWVEVSNTVYHEETADTPAYVETYVTGYICPECGAAKEA